MNSNNFRVFRKIRLEKESEITSMRLFNIKRAVLAALFECDGQKKETNRIPSAGDRFLV